jgi:hypothetical protein
MEKISPGALIRKSKPSPFYRRFGHVLRVQLLKRSCNSYTSVAYTYNQSKILPLAGTGEYQVYFQLMIIA